MKNLYAPWRSNYIVNDNKEKLEEKSCPFCLQFAQNQDEKNFILKRFKHCAVMLNLHPYNAGHLLVLPFAHKANLRELDESARAEIIEVISKSNEIVTNVLGCTAINVGLSLGKDSGGSIPDHLHFHIIPRWPGDTNFLVITAETKVISFNLHEIYERLRVHF